MDLLAKRCSSTRFNSTGTIIWRTCTTRWMDKISITSELISFDWWIHILSSNTFSSSTINKFRWIAIVDGWRRGSSAMIALRSIARINSYRIWTTGFLGQILLDSRPHHVSLFQTEAAQNDFEREITVLQINFTTGRVEDALRVHSFVDSFFQLHSRVLLGSPNQSYSMCFCIHLICEAILRQYFSQYWLEGFMLGEQSYVSLGVDSPLETTNTWDSFAQFYWWTTTVQEWKLTNSTLTFLRITNGVAISLFLGSSYCETNHYAVPPLYHGQYTLDHWMSFDCTLMKWLRMKRLPLPIHDW